MANGTKLERALASAAADIASQGKRFALVGGLAVSVRAEVRFTRDVDLAVAVNDDTEAEALVYALQSRGYTSVASVEHEAQARLATIRLRSPQGVKVDLLFASSGIERELIERATIVELPSVGALPVACSEELLALKILSMDDERLQDRLDARNILRIDTSLDLERVRTSLSLIEQRGYARRQDLNAKLRTLLDALH